METTVIEVTCLRCKTTHSVLVPSANYKLWATGQRHIQDALPMLSDDERELLLSGLCPRCWDALFGE